MNTRFKVGDSVTYGQLEGKVHAIWPNLKKVEARFQINNVEFIVLCDRDGHSGLSRFSSEWPMVIKSEKNISHHDSK
jgi:hypothetical protein